MKRIKALSLTAILALVMTIGAIAAQIQVTGHHVRLRWGPSTNSAIYCNDYGKPIYPSKGQYLAWSGRASNGFFEVYYGGNTLYISCQFARAVGSTASSVPSRVRVCGTNVYLRYGPGKDYATYDYFMQKGYVLNCVGSSGNWWKVYVNGMYMYINKKYAKPY